MVLQQLKISIVKDKPNVCILHDMHACILNAINTLKKPGKQSSLMDIQSWDQVLLTIQE
jgi:hypothetical protein